MKKIKAIFLDYTGTITEENCPAVQEVVIRCYKNSIVKSPGEMLTYWWTNLKRMEEESYGEQYVTEDELVDTLLKQCREEIELKDNLNELHQLFQNFWMYSPVYEDAKEFFKNCKLPIYIVTNNGAEYVQECMRVNNLHPAGIICGDMVRAYKPHKELFQKALEISGCSGTEVLHIGDSLSSDVKGALSAGITPIYLNRMGKKTEEMVKSVQLLTEVLDLI